MLQKLIIPNLQYSLPPICQFSFIPRSWSGGWSAAVLGWAARAPSQAVVTDACGGQHLLQPFESVVDRRTETRPPALHAAAPDGLGRNGRRRRPAAGGDLGRTAAGAAWAGRSGHGRLSRGTGGCRLPQNTAPGSYTLRGGRHCTGDHQRARRTSGTGTAKSRGRVPSISGIRSDEGAMSSCR